MTTITFDLKEDSHVLVSVFDVSGRLVARLVDRVMTAGRHSVYWDGKLYKSKRPAQSGVYFIKLRAGRTVDTKKAILLR